MDGIIYLLNQAGIALAQANDEIARLRTENATLKAEPAPETFLPSV